MPDADCQNACAEAYAAQVSQCANVLRDNLALAKTDQDKQLAQARFDRCMALAAEVKAACLQACQEN